jgi:moderate conductance mechanosensitive channel
VFTTASISMRDILFALAIAIPVFIFAVIFFFVFRRVAQRMAVRTKTVLDNMLIESLELPLFIGIVLSGLYFSILHLPWKESLHFEIGRAFHTVFILLAAYAGIALLDSLYRWFKLEVASKTQTALDDWIIGVLRIVTPILIILIAILAALGLFDLDTGAVRDWLVVHGTRIGLILVLAVAALLILGFAGAKGIRAFVARGAPGQPDEEVKKRADTLSSVLITAGQVFIIVIAAFIVLSELGINIGPILAGAGVVGIAIGFGAQSLVKDLISGVFIIMENQYRVGDVVRIADISGLVEQINLRRTMLRDLDGIVHVVPNGEIRVASNFTKEWSRVNLNISVSYGTDLDHATAVINRVCQQMAQEPEWAPIIIKTPQVLRVDNLGDSGIDLKILGDTKPIRQWDVMGEIRKRVKKAFDEEGIEIPWPHTKVFFGNPIPPQPEAIKQKGTE